MTAVNDNYRLPRRAAVVGDIRMAGDRSFCKVIAIEDIGPNSPGQWPAWVRNVTIEYQGELRTMREKSFLLNYDTIAERQAFDAEMRHHLPEHWHEFFEL